MPASSSKHVVLVGPASPYRGGIAHFMHATFQGLLERGHRVEIVNFKRQYPGLLFPGKTQYEVSPERAAIPSQRIIDSVNPLSWMRAVRYIRSLKPDVVIFKHWMPFFAPAYGFIARRLRACGIKVLCVVHNALPHERRPGDLAMSKYFFSACDGFIVMSSAVERDLNKLGAVAPKLQVGHPVYDHFGSPVSKQSARSRLHIDPEAPVALFFGFVRRYKGLQVLLESMPAVIQTLPNLKLLVAGECYEDEAQYRDFIAKNDLSDHVSLRFEYIPESDIPDLFSAADIVVQPYASATQSGVAQIAFHYERPLIVTDVGGLAEIVPHEKAGLVVPPQDPIALASSILRFFEDDMGTKLHAGVLKQKALHSWDRLLDAIEELA